MSRAFTKEDDAGDEFHERPVPQGPNYVTPRGLDLLRRAVRELVAKREAAADKRAIDRDLRYLEARIDAAIVVPRGSGREARFGATVTLQDARGAERAYRIVGEDEAGEDPESLLPWSAPLAQALLGAAPGAKVTWEGPESAETFTVLSVEF